MTVMSDLGNDQNVRPHTAILDHEVLASPTEAGLNLINDQENAMLVADGSQPLQERIRCRNITPFSEKGFNQDGRCVTRRRLLCQ